MHALFGLFGLLIGLAGTLGVRLGRSMVDQAMPLPQDPEAARRQESFRTRYAYALTGFFWAAGIAFGVLLALK
jgi:hypothetical protein